MPLVTLHWDEVPMSHFIYECLWALAFVVVVLFARSRGEITRFFGGMIYGFVTEMVVYVGLEAAQFQGVGRAYDHGLFTVMLFGISPLYMDLFWWPVVIYVVEYCARCTYRTKTLMSRLLIATTVAVFADFAIEPVAVTYGLWVYRTGQMQWQSWVGAPYANNIAWFGIQGGFVFGCYCSDVVRGLTRNSWIIISDISTFVTQVLASWIGMGLWCLLMTAFRSPYGIIRFISDQVQLGVLMFGVLVYTMWYTFVVCAKMEPKVPQTQLGSQAIKSRFPAVLMVLWQASSFAFKLVYCKTNSGSELCTENSTLVLGCCAGFSVLLTFLPSYWKEYQNSMTDPSTASVPPPVPPRDTPSADTPASDAPKDLGATTSYEAAAGDYGTGGGGCRTPTPPVDEPPEVPSLNPFDVGDDAADDDDGPVQREQSPIVGAGSVNGEPDADSSPSSTRPTSTASVPSPEAEKDPSSPNGTRRGNPANPFVSSPTPALVTEVCGETASSSSPPMRDVAPAWVFRGSIPTTGDVYFASLNMGRSKVPDETTRAILERLTLSRRAICESVRGGCFEAAINAIDEYLPMLKGLISASASLPVDICKKLDFKWYTPFTTQYCRDPLTIPTLEYELFFILLMYGFLHRVAAKEILQSYKDNKIAADNPKFRGITEYLQKAIGIFHFLETLPLYTEPEKPKMPILIELHPEMPKLLAYMCIMEANGILVMPALQQKINTEDVAQQCLQISEMASYCFSSVCRITQKESNSRLSILKSYFLLMKYMYQGQALIFRGQNAWDHRNYNLALTYLQAALPRQIHDKALKSHKNRDCMPEVLNEAAGFMNFVKDLYRKYTLEHKSTEFPETPVQPTTYADPKANNLQLSFKEDSCSLC
ncbi:hypothetical protein Pelo_9362 [Pelomyxa schiedti]|nr:hypothetical protein Pelo_9362 [Pelomyxa schiedti]